MTGPALRGTLSLPTLGQWEGRPRMSPQAGPDRPHWGWPPRPPQDGWNILNFLIIFILLLGFFINELSSISITYTLR